MHLIITKMGGMLGLKYMDSYFRLIVIKMMYIWAILMYTLQTYMNITTVSTYHKKINSLINDEIEDSLSSIDSSEDDKWMHVEFLCRPLIAIVI